MNAVIDKVDSSGSLALKPDHASARTSRWRPPRATDIQPANRKRLTTFPIRSNQRQEVFISLLLRPSFNNESRCVYSSKFTPAVRVTGTYSAAGHQSRVLAIGARRYFFPQCDDHRSSRCMSGVQMGTCPCILAQACLEDWPLVLIFAQSSESGEYHSSLC